MLLLGLLLTSLHFLKCCFFVVVVVVVVFRFLYKVQQKCVWGTGFMNVKDKCERLFSTSTLKMFSCFFFKTLSSATPPSNKLYTCQRTEAPEVHVSITSMSGCSFTFGVAYHIHPCVHNAHWNGQLNIIQWLWMMCKPLGQSLLWRPLQLHSRNPFNCNLISENENMPDSLRMCSQSLYCTSSYI